MRPATGDGTTTAQAMTAIVKKFREAAERAYPEPVDEETFAELLAGLCATARLVCDKSSFYTWIYEKEEVEEFLNRRFEMEMEEYPVKGSRIGHYVVQIYYQLGDTQYVEPQYVVIEWVPAAGYSYDEMKIFRCDAPAELPLGSAINILLSIGR